MVLCSPGSLSSNALFDTDAIGSTRFNGPISAGGCADGLSVVVQGIIIADPATGCSSDLCLPYTMRSPDIDGDLVVNIVDISIFASAWPPGPYATCSDFDGDGVIGLVDLSIVAQHFGHDCVIAPCP